MYGFEGLWFVLVVVVIATPIMALVAFLRTGVQRREIDRLRSELSALIWERDRQRPAPARPEPAHPRPERAPQVTERVPPPPPEPAPPKPPPQPVATTPPPPPPKQQPTPPRAAPIDWSRASTAFERLFVANWLIWVGALALALGGIFLVRFAWEQGYFGPEARTVVALIAGLAMIAGSEWMRRRADPDAPGQLPHAPLAVATAGVVTLYVAAYAAGPLYTLVPPLVALTGFVLASAAAVVLAMVHGVFLAALGFIGGYLAPLLVGGGDPEPLLVLGYVLAITLAALVLVRAFDWKPLVWVALGGGAVWAFIGSFWMHYGTGPLAFTIYLLALVAASTWLAWDDAEKPERPPAQTVFVASGFWIVAGAGLITPLTGYFSSYLDPLVAGVMLYAASSLYAGWRRQGLALAPLLGAALLVLAGLSIDHDELASGLPLEAALWTGAAITGVGGWLAMRTMPSKGVMAFVSAFTPLILLVIAHGRLGEFGQDIRWGLVGGLLALLNLLALEGLSRTPGGLDKHKAAAASYALAAFAGSMFAVATTLQQMWMTALFALHLPAIALIDRRFNLPALKLAASIAGLVASARLLIPDEVLSYAISPTPLLNELAPLYGIPILSFWGAARIFESSLKDSRHNIVQAMDVAAIALGAVLLSVEVRHLVTGGDLRAGFAGLIETGAYCLAWTALALGLAARQGAAPRRWLVIAGHVVFAVAIGIAVLGLGIRSNPLLSGDFQPRSLEGPLFFNLMMPSYLAPAALLALLGHLKRSQKHDAESHIAGFTALALVFLYVSLEVRNYFHDASDFASAAVGEIERYSCSVVWILFSIATLLVGVARRRVAIRHAAMAVLALSIVKVFVFDMASLDGVLRAASFFGLGVALIGVALLYQKLVFARDPRPPEAPPA